MAEYGGGKWKITRSSLLIATVNFLLFVLVAVSADRGMKLPDVSTPEGTRRSFSDELRIKKFLEIAKNFLWKSDGSVYERVWPDIKFGWPIVLGTIVGFIGGAFGSIGGVGGGGLFLPMLNLILEFDAKSSTAMSKCMIMGAAVSTVYYNLRQRHPLLDVPMIDYDLVLLVQPMLLLGISIGVIFNVVFADWMVTILLIILFLFISIKAFMRGVETWKKESLLKREATVSQSQDGEGDYKVVPGGPQQETGEAQPKISILKNVCWKELGLLFFVWVAFLILQILKENTVSCSWEYWTLNFLQIPVSVGVYLYEAIGLYKGRRVITSLGEHQMELRVGQLATYACLGMSAGIVGGLLGVGGGSIMGPLFLELGVLPQVASASATFAMMFSSSMSVVEYYLLNQFPVPYAAYLAAVAMVAAYCGQHIVGKVIALLGRASIIIFVLSFMVFISSLTLGGVGISKSIQRLQRHEYMGFVDLCSRASG